ncbi:MAG: lactonase family protein [Pirellulales bacterium]
MRWISFLFAAAAFAGLGLWSPVRAEQMLVYIGTYTGSGSQGIYAAKFDTAEGTLSEPSLAAESSNPSFVALHPGGRYLYAVNEDAQYQGQDSGAVSAYSVDRQSGRLTPLGSQPSGGAAPCHLAVDRTGKYVLAANYSGGSTIVLPITEGGGLGPASDFVQHTGSSVDPRRQRAPHAHGVYLDPTNRFALVADLGLDKVLIFRFNPQQGTLSPNEPAAANVAPGSGPRHLAIHPSGRYVYAINEITSTLTAFQFDPQSGAMQQLHTLSTLPEGHEGGNSTAEIQIHPSGKFLYGSNRGHNSIAIFRVDEDSGRVTSLGHQPSGGETPRNFNIDPTGQYLLAANQGSDDVVVFRIDAESGKLTATGESITVSRPVCVEFLPLAATAE